MKILILLSVVGAGVLGYTDPLCGGYDSESLNFCVDCWQSYSVNGTCKEVTSKIDNCVVYKTDGKCETCALGYFLTSTKTCEKITEPFCLRKNKNGCNLCSGKIPKNGSCQEACNVKNCRACDKKGECEFCNSGYHINSDDECIKSTSDYENCLWTDVEEGDDEECTYCDYGYHLEQGKCIRIESITDASRYSFRTSIVTTITETNTTNATASTTNTTNATASTTNTTNATASTTNTTNATDSTTNTNNTTDSETNTNIDKRVSQTDASAVALSTGVAALITALLYCAGVA